MKGDLLRAFRRGSAVVRHQSPICINVLGADVPSSRKTASKSSGSRADLDPYRAGPLDQALTTNQGVKIADDQNSLRGGERGPTLLEDFILREKITHFDHERIPERVVHARGFAAHGYFEVYEAMTEFTKAEFLQNPGVKTPVFARFSTVGGSRGSADTPRDVRGFAVKFYTQAGNFDLVGNNMPVFFIQDAIKFPDFVHAVKPEPHNEIPQASSAHDTFWDFVSLNPESTHMVLWLMSDRALPKSVATMEGFGVHTFRLINAQGESRYVKFHWKPKLGCHSLVWDEAQKLMGKDPDFHRRDMYEAIEAGMFPEWELGVQIFGDKEADSFDFDILDATKLIPEELVPVKRIGKMVLDRNPQSYFAETEQVAFCISHIVPGIDFTNDPLLQGRLFSYLDTQLTRLGGPNFHEIPINRPVCPFANGQRDGMHRMRIDTGDASYGPNSLDGNFPAETPVEQGGFATYPERIDGVKRRIRAASFADHFSQARLFWLSMSPVEQQHIIAAISFELSKVEHEEIRRRVVDTMLVNIDSALTAAVCENIGLSAPKSGGKGVADVKPSPALSQIVHKADGAVTARKIAVLVADGVDAAGVEMMKTGLEAKGAVVMTLSAKLGHVSGVKTDNVAVDKRLITMPSISFDAVVIPGGAAAAATLAKSGDVRLFVAEAYKHGKAIAAITEGAQLLDAVGILKQAPGIVTGAADGALIAAFADAISLHRAWDRSDLDAIAA